MGFDFEERKTLLYADLFKLQGNHGNNNTIMSSSNSSSYCDSSSSGFASPFGSESDESDGDFAAELSRQMAECMLREEEEEQRNSVVTQSAAAENLKYDPILDHANRTPCIKLENQFPIGDEVGVWGGRRVKGGELTQQTKTEQSYGRYRGGREWRGGAGRKGRSGSGMQAVFLGGSGSRNGSPAGTGVFLPRATKDSVELKKKTGLSTVLIPTRVLEALELHFQRHSDSAATAGSPQHASPTDERMASKGRGSAHRKIEMEEAIKVDEMQILPQEWTY